MKPPVIRCVALLLVVGVRVRSASAQATTVNLPPNPAVIHTTASVNVGTAFSASPGVVTQNSLQGNPCNPGACFDAPVTVKANTKWQLQVTLNPPPTDFIVIWVESRSPVITHQLTAGTFQTVASGTTVTPGQNVALLFNANKTTGKGGFVPTAAQLAAVLSYRVIAAP